MTSKTIKQLLKIKKVEYMKLLKGYESLNDEDIHFEKHLALELNEVANCVGHYTMMLEMENAGKRKRKENGTT